MLSSSTGCYELWPAFRAMYKYHKNILLKPSMQYAMGGDGQEIFLFDTQTKQVYLYVHDVGSTMEAPLLIRELSGRNYRLVGYFAGAYFLLDEHQTFYCWDIEKSRNQLIDPRHPLDTNKTPYVIDHVTKFSIGQFHILCVLFDEEEDLETQIFPSVVWMATWTVDNLMNVKQIDEHISIVPHKRLIRFNEQVLDVVCFEKSGSLVLLASNMVYGWGTFNDQMKQYQNNEYKLDLNVEAKQMTITNTYVCFLCENGQILLMEYSGKSNFEPVRNMENLPEPIVQIESSWRTSNILMYGQSQKVYLFLGQNQKAISEQTERIVEIEYDFDFHPCRLYIDSNPITLIKPDKDKFFNETQFDLMDKKYVHYNNPFDCDSYFTILNLVIYIKKDTFFRKILAATSHDWASKNGEWYRQQFCSLIKLFPVPVGLAYLNYLFNGTIDIEDYHRTDLLGLANAIKDNKLITSLGSTPFSLRKIGAV